MRTRRRPLPSPSWPEQRALWRDSERVLVWFERERLVALWMHGASTRSWVVRALTTVSLVGDGWIWYAIIAALPWWGGPVGGSAAVLSQVSQMRWRPRTGAQLSSERLPQAPPRLLRWSQS